MVRCARDPLRPPSHSPDRHTARQEQGHAREDDAGRCRPPRAGAPRWATSRIGAWADGHRVLGVIFPTRSARPGAVYVAGYADSFRLGTSGQGKDGQAALRRLPDLMHEVRDNCGGRVAELERRGIGEYTFGLLCSVKHVVKPRNRIVTTRGRRPIKSRPASRPSKLARKASGEFCEAIKVSEGAAAA